MSYSRWSHSTWYTYWCVSSGEKKEDQVFCVCGEMSFTYEELEADMKSCLKKVHGDVELKGYMVDFMSDVEREFKK